MKEILRRQFRQYIKEFNPDLLAVLQDSGRLEEFLEENLDSVEELMDGMIMEQVTPIRILEQCMAELTRPLRPSRYHYCLKLLEEWFPDCSEKLREGGLLQIELIGFISIADPLFDELRFSEDTKKLDLIRYAILGALLEFSRKYDNQCL
ncbi:MAG: hypothetical protein HYZ15_01360 [Sphingobacteriales bacterium]|nr:hypothetical protein [Sphingobacteriales bacterium]